MTTHIIAVGRRYWREHMPRGYRVDWAWWDADTAGWTLADRAALAVIVGGAA